MSSSACYRQKSATFSPHIHRTWGPAFSASLYFFYPNLPIEEEEDLLSPFLAAPLPRRGSDLPRLVAQEPEIAHWRSFQDCNQQHPTQDDGSRQKTETFWVIGNHSPHARFVFFPVHSLLGRGKVEGYDWACQAANRFSPMMVLPSDPIRLPRPPPSQS